MSSNGDSNSERTFLFQACNEGTSPAYGFVSRSSSGGSGRAWMKREALHGMPEPMGGEAKISFARAPCPGAILDRCPSTACRRTGVLHSTLYRRRRLVQRRLSLRVVPLVPHPRRASVLCTAYGSATVLRPPGRGRSGWTGWCITFLVLLVCSFLSLLC